MTNLSWKKTRKHRRLKCLWRSLKVDIIGLAETHVNPAALQSKALVTDNSFRAESNLCVFNNNSAEIAGPRQQG